MNASEMWPEPEAVPELVALEMVPYGEKFTDNAKLDVVAAEELAEAQRQYDVAVATIRSIGARLRANAEAVAAKPLIAQRAAENLTYLAGRGRSGYVSGVLRSVKESGAVAAAEHEARELLAQEVGTAATYLAQSGRAFFDKADTLVRKSDLYNTKAAELQRRAQRAAEDL